jgi:hypothetical protein
MRTFAMLTIPVRFDVQLSRELSKLKLDHGDRTAAINNEQMRSSRSNGGGTYGRGGGRSAARESKPRRMGRRRSGGTGTPATRYL